MALPVADSYPITPGRPVYFGVDAMPNWLPAVGAIGTVGLNAMSSVYPTGAPDTRTRGSEAVLSAWNSTVFASDLGAMGSIIAWGGGHADYLGNEVYRYDIATRVCSLIVGPFDIPVSYHLGTQADDPNDGPNTGTGVSSTAHGEYWASDEKSAEVVGQKCATHTYGHLIYVPAAQAGNTSGWLVMVGNFNVQAHYVDLDNPSAGWSRLGPMMDVTPAYGLSLFDTLRSRIVVYPYVNGPGTTCRVLSLSTLTWSNISQDYLRTYYGVGHYMEADDLYLVMRAHNPDDAEGVLQIHDPVTGAKYRPTCTGDVPAYGAAGTPEWIESTRQVVYWPGAGSTLYTGQAPANPRTGTWVWTARAYSGDAPVTSYSANPMYRRLHYVPALQSLVHIGRMSQPAQAWRI